MGCSLTSGNRVINTKLKSDPNQQARIEDGMGRVSLFTVKEELSCFEQSNVASHRVSVLSGIKDASIFTNGTTSI